ncbi:general stress protein [Sphingomonas prati]|uniref:Putative membrane protein n=1 Tax=Sphingomonas prati TaxID=1843237 RepID=A0A7W9F1F3_9SPHN|nr:general stress protein [Sphingomonas prati]MBB5729258.1 putative membrane protein [Sphingomonas prati]GGE83912.1 hypothetical protein GCM10011404_15700 [Sphingomonas prati]
MTTTITRLFDSHSDAKHAVTELEALGVPHSDISILGNDPDHVGDHDDGVDHAGDVDRGVKTGAAIGGVGGLLAGLGLLAIPGIGPIVAAGWLATTLAGAGLGAAGGAATGTIVGALTDAGHSSDDAGVYAEGVRRGSTLVSARVADAHADAAEVVLNKYGAVTATDRGRDYASNGWSGYDASAPAYTLDEMQAERSRYGRRTDEI